MFLFVKKGENIHFGVEIEQRLKTKQFFLSFSNRNNTKRKEWKREKESAEGSTGKTCGGEKGGPTDKKGKTDGTGKAKDTEKTSDADKVTVSASSWEELLKKINNVIYESRADSVMTKEEKAVGQSFDYSI